MLVWFATPPIEEEQEKVTEDYYRGGIAVLGVPPLLFLWEGGELEGRAIPLPEMTADELRALFDFLLLL